MTNDHSIHIDDDDDDFKNVSIEQNNRLSAEMHACVCKSLAQVYCQDYLFIPIWATDSEMYVVSLNECIDVDFIRSFTENGYVLDLELLFHAFIGGKWRMLSYYNQCFFRSHSIIIADSRLESVISALEAYHFYS